MSITVFSSMDHLPQGTYLADCAVSGGTLEDFLKRALQFSHKLLCVRMKMVYMDFTLPCPTGVGTPLNEAQASALLAKRMPVFSPALCTNYVTFLEDQRLHAVLADSPETLRKKLRLAESLGVPYALAETEQIYRLLGGR